MIHNLLAILSLAICSTSQDLDSAGKPVHFFPEPLILAKNPHAIIFYSDTKLINLLTQINVSAYGQKLRIDRHCAPAMETFYNRIFDTLYAVHEAAHRLFSFQGATNLIECGTYLAKFYYFTTREQSTMVCPHHYAPSLKDCKLWATKHCTVQSRFEKSWLQNNPSQQKAPRSIKCHRRSSWACHAGLAGVIRWLYKSFGGSCASTQVTHIKSTLFKITDAMQDLQSMIHVVNGKTAILIKTANIMTRKLNSLILDVRQIDSTLQEWQELLNIRGRFWNCTTNTLLEFLGKFAGQTVQLFFTILRLLEADDIVRQAKRLEGKPLVVISELPDFVATELMRQLKIHEDMKNTIKALHTGFPLLMQPLVNYQHSETALKLNILMTVPQIKDQNAICTLQYLTPVKYNISGTCYTGPVTRRDLALIVCPNSRSIIRTDTLNKCIKQDETFLCPEIVIPREEEPQWLGMYWTPTSKVTYKRRHTLAQDCTSLKPLIHLGGRYYLATTDSKLRIKNHTEQELQLTPLTVYTFPCEITLYDQETGLGRCPETLTIHLPIFTTNNVNYVSWKGMSDNSFFELHYNSLKIPPPMTFDQNTTDALDKTYQFLDNRLSYKLKDIKKSISKIKEGSPTTLNDALTYAALALATLNSIVIIIILRLWNRGQSPKQKQMPAKKEIDIELKTLEKPTRKEICHDCNKPLTAKI